MCSPKRLWIPGGEAGLWPVLCLGTGAWLIWIHLSTGSQSSVELTNTGTQVWWALFWNFGLSWQAGEGRVGMVGPWGPLLSGSPVTQYTVKISVTSLPSLWMTLCSVCTNLTSSLCFLCLFSAPMCGISHASVMEMVFKNLFLLSDQSLSRKWISL